jgi:hypothetical protein
MAYQKQHYVPFVYLREFSENPTDDRKTSYIWRVSHPFIGRVKTVKACWEPFFNSKANPEQAEGMFGHYEGKYADFAKRVSARQPPNDWPTHFAPLIQMISLHLRNPAYANRTGEERARIYPNMEVEFWTTVIPPDSDPERLLETALLTLMDAWDVCVLETSEGSFVTSDNPVRLYAACDDTPPTILMMPVNPSAYAVAFRKSHWMLSNPTIGRLDYLRLNTHAVRYCQQSVYCNVEPEADEKVVFLEELKKRHASPGFFGDEIWCINRIPLVQRFDFLAPIKMEGAS